MRRTGVFGFRLCVGFLAVLGLIGCQIAGPNGDAAPNGPAPDVSPITGLAIEVTTLGDPAAADVAAPETAPETAVETAPDLAAQPTLRPEPRPKGIADAAVAASDAATAADVVPEVLKSPQQLQCEKQQGVWSVAGDTGARICVYQTRDGGKACTKGTQCQGQCLARSGSCSPITPLFGCNEILDDDGRRVTLCID